MEQMAQRDAALLDRIDTLRRQGRLLLSTEGFTAESTGAVNGKLFSAAQPKRGPDVWDHILHAVTAQGRVRRHHGRHVASQVASKIHAYWDGYAAKKDRAKVQEEKRLRMLAKTTVKMVANEWKKAVFVCFCVIIC